MHIGFIVDGNRRWAKEKNLPTLKGHQKGLEKVEMVIEELAKTAEVKFATFFLFSTENWNRTKEEVDYLMALLNQKVISLAEKMQRNNVKCLVLGSKNNIPPKVQAGLNKAEEITKDCTGLTACICFNYGGKLEIADAAKSLASCVHAKLGPCPTADQLDQYFTVENFEKHLYHPEVPACDMIVRTSGEERISGFMLWRAAYAEFLFLKKYFPDIEAEDVKNILKEYQNRHRRFGK